MVSQNFYCRSKEMCTYEKHVNAPYMRREFEISDFEKILPYTDLFLYDVKAISDDLHKQGTGASNRLILENLENCPVKGR